MKSTTINRTFSFPVLKPVEGEYKDFYSDLRFSLKTACSVYNRVLSHAFSNDKENFLLHATGNKIAKFPKILNPTAYKAEADIFPPSTKGQCASIVMDAESKYRTNRFDIIIGKKTLPNQRSVPFPILRNDDKTKVWMSIDEYGNEHLYCQFKLLKNHQECRTWLCELKSGSNYAVHLSRLKKLWQKKNDEGNLIYKDCKDTIDDVGDSKIWIDGKGHIIIGLSIRLPIQEKSRCGTLRVSTTKHSLLVISKDKSVIPYTFNADNIVRWQSERDRKQQRLRQDKKCDRNRRKSINERQREESKKYSNRVKNECHKISKWVIDYANRNNIKKIELDTTIKSFLPSFTWFDLEQKIKYKCEDFGIEYEKITRSIVEPDITDPHIYFQMAIDENGKPSGKVKIGKTTSGKKRKKDLENMGGQKLVYLCGDKQSKSNLTKKEKEYHSLFRAHKTDVGTEWFKLEPILEWIEEVGVLGNMGNMDEINQYIDKEILSNKAKSRGGVTHETPLALENDGNV